MTNALLPIPFSQSLFAVKSIHAKIDTNNKMVSIRCRVFVFAMIFMLLHFLAYSLQDTEKMVSAKDRFEERTTLLSRAEKDGLKVVPTRVGRKTMKIVHEERINGEEMASKKASSSSANPRNDDDKVTKAASSSSNPRNNIGDHKVPIASSSSANPRNGNHKVPKRQKKIYHHDHEHYVEVKMRSTFMALNADYHVPRSHPPRNN